EILKKMNRHYDTRQFTEKIEAIRRIVPDIAITTDVIVGFPGETDERFEETVHTIRRLNFAEMHVFPYSVRTRTPAAKMKAQIDPQIKKARVHKLIKLSDHLKSLYYQKFNGCILEVLIENQETKTGLYYGHTSNYMLVRINATEDVKHKVVSVVFSSDGVSQIIDA
ncbi:MAG: radical SAM protein, partial [Bacilli bacterium]